MQHEEVLDRIAQARALLREVIAGTESPMIERSVMLADMNLHWAQWNLGVPTSLMPDSDQE